LTLRWLVVCCCWLRLLALVGWLFGWDLVDLRWFVGRWLVSWLLVGWLGRCWIAFGCRFRWLVFVRVDCSLVGLRWLVLFSVALLVAVSCWFTFALLNVVVALDVCWLVPLVDDCWLVGLVLDVGWLDVGWLLCVVVRCWLVGWLVGLLVG